MQIFIILRNILATPALLVGLVTFLGLLLQKKSADHVIKGTVITVVGFVLLSAGSDFLSNGALKDFGVLFNYAFHIQGVVPNMEAIASLGIAQYTMEVSMVLFLGMVANLILARLGPSGYIFLTGHHTLYMACLLTVVLHESSMKSWQIVLSASLVLGLFMTFMPALVEKEMKTVTGSDKIAFGHFSAIGCLAAARTARLTASWKRHAEQEERPSGTARSTEEIHFPSRLSFMRDSTVGIFLVMTVIFLIVAGIAAMRTDLNLLDISYQADGCQHWIIYALLQGARFSASIYIILAGVRLVIAEIVPAFKGIAKKLVPHARPAVDCPILFSCAPNAVMIGFLMSFLGGLMVMLLLMGINAWQETILVPVIVPGITAHFFCGGSAGVFANAEGGVRGCILGSFVHGILISLLSLFVMPVIGTLNLSGTSFSDSDFCLAGILFGNLASFLPEYGLLLFCALCFLAPIVWEQMRTRRKTDG